MDSTPRRFRRGKCPPHSGLSFEEESMIRPFRSSLTVLPALALLAVPGSAWQATPPAAPTPAQVAAQEDRQKMLDLLHIASLRGGVEARNPQSPNKANYDESKANPYPNLPDPLTLKNGKK